MGDKVARYVVSRLMFSVLALFYLSLCLAGAEVLAYAVGWAWGWHMEDHQVLLMAGALTAAPQGRAMYRWLTTT